MCFPQHYPHPPNQRIYQITILRLPIRPQHIINWKKQPYHYQPITPTTDYSVTVEKGCIILPTLQATVPLSPELSTDTIYIYVLMSSKQAH